MWGWSYLVAGSQLSRLSVLQQRCGAGATWLLGLNSQDYQYFNRDVGLELLGCWVSTLKTISTSTEMWGWSYLVAGSQLSRLSVLQQRCGAGATWLLGLNSQDYQYFNRDVGLELPGCWVSTLKTISTSTGMWCWSYLVAGSQLSRLSVLQQGYGAGATWLLGLNSQDYQYFNRMWGWCYLVAGSQLSRLSVLQQRCGTGATWLLGLNSQDYQYFNRDVGLELPGCWVSTLKTISTSTEMWGWSYLVAGSQLSRLSVLQQDVVLVLPGCWVSTLKTISTSTEMWGWCYLVAGSQLSRLSVLQQRCGAGATWLLGLNSQDYQDFNRDVGLVLPGCWASTLKTISTSTEMWGWSYLVARSQLSRLSVLQQGSGAGATWLLGLNSQYYQYFNRDAGLELPGCWVSTFKTISTGATCSTEMWGWSYLVAGSQLSRLSVLQQRCGAGATWLLGLNSQDYQDFNRDVGLVLPGCWASTLKTIMWVLQQRCGAGATWLLGLNSQDYQYFNREVGLELPGCWVSTLKTISTSTEMWGWSYLVARSQLSRLSVLQQGCGAGATWLLGLNSQDYQDFNRDVGLVLPGCWASTLKTISTSTEMWGWSYLVARSQLSRLSVLQQGSGAGATWLLGLNSQYYQYFNRDAGLELPGSWVSTFKTISTSTEMWGWSYLVAGSQLSRLSVLQQRCGTGATWLLGLNSQDYQYFNRDVGLELPGCWVSTLKTISTSTEMWGWSYLVAGSLLSRLSVLQQGCGAGATWLLGLNFQDYQYFNRDVGLELPGCWVSTFKTIRTSTGMWGWCYLVAGSQLSRLSVLQQGCGAGATWLLGLNYQDYQYFNRDVVLVLPGCWASTLKTIKYFNRDVVLVLPGCWVSTIKIISTSTEMWCWCYLVAGSQLSRLSVLQQGCGAGATWLLGLNSQDYQYFNRDVVLELPGCWGSTIKTISTSTGMRGWSYLVAGPQLSRLSVLQQRSGAGATWLLGLNSQDYQYFNRDVGLELPGCWVSTLKTISTSTEMWGWSYLVARSQLSRLSVLQQGCRAGTTWLLGLNSQDYQYFNRDVGLELPGC